MTIARSFLFVLCLLCISYLFSSCVNTKKATYFNEIQDTVLNNPTGNIESVIQRNDLLSISVSSLNPEASYIFNMPNLMTATAPSTSSAMTVTGGSTAGTTGSPAGGQAQVIGYLVGPDGRIKFPVLGIIPVAGLTKRQLEAKLTDSLSERKLLVDPIVNVRFLNFRVTVLGEVAKPTTINVVNERISILEALGLAGDLTIYAKRDNVLLIREDNGQKIIRRIDMNSEKILTSPYYYLKTNDVVYVEPNASKIAASSRSQQLAPILISALALVVLIATYIKDK
jgi:polysaccharide export outer membrane protein